MNNYANNVAYKKPFHQSSLKSVFSALFGGVAFLLFILFIFMGDDVDLLSKEGASTVLYAVLPSTFPYLVLSGILLESAFPYYLGKAMAPLTNFLKLSPLSAVALFTAPISGFPLPSSIAWELFEHGEISEEECSRISGFCSFCGPPFIISLFGIKIMKDIKAGVICYVVQTILMMVLGKLLDTGATFHTRRSIQKEKSTDNSLSLVICNSISRAGISMLKITAFVIFFTVLSGIIKELLILAFPTMHPIGASIICGILEMSSGVTSLSNLEISEKLRFILGVSYIYWSGFSVFFQVASTMNGRISMKKYIIGRLLMLLFGVPLSYFVYFYLL